MKRSVLVGAVMLVVGGCEANRGADEATVAAQGALTQAQARVMGFEAPLQDWSSSRPLSVGSPPSDGSAALGVSPNGWTEIASVKLSSLGAVTGTLSYDVRIPAALPYWGETRVVIQIPSRGIWWSEVGSFSLMGRQPGVYHRVDFMLPPAVTQALRGSYDDLVFRLVVNAPTLSGPYLVDNLRLPVSAGGGGAGGAAGGGGAGGQLPPPQEPGIPDRPPLPDDQIEVVLPLSVPLNFNLQELTIIGLDSVKVEDGVKLTNQGGAFSKIVNVGTGQLTVGVGAEVGTVVSTGGVFLANNAVVHGDVTTGGQIQTQAGARVEGATLTGQSIPILRGTSRVRLPKALRPAVRVEPGQTGPTPAPGSFQELAIKSNARLTLLAGNYYFRSVNLEPDSILTIDDRGGAVNVFVADTLNLKGRIERVLAGAPALRVYYLGTGAAFVSGPFRGSLLAPSGTINLERTLTSRHEALILGRSLRIAAGAGFFGVLPQLPGSCIFQPDGTACDDGNACTSFDRCSGLRCVGSPVLCLSTECRQSSFCEALTGQCVHPPAPDGTSCTSVPGGICTGGICGNAAARLPTSSQFIQRVTDESELGDVESEEMQGIAETSQHWYWMSVGLIQRVPTSGSSITSPVDRSVPIPAAVQPADIFRDGFYNHFGDGDFHDGLLYVPLTGAAAPFSIGKPPNLVVVFDADLNLRAWAELPKGGAWLSVNPRDGFLYSSQDFFTLQAFDITDLKAKAGAATPSKATLAHVGSRELVFNVLPRSCPEGPPGSPFGGLGALFGDICKGVWGAAWIQGGDFSPNGVFYYVHDNENADDSNFTGVHIFDVAPFGPNDRGVVGAPASQVPITPDGYIKINYDATTTIIVDVSRGDELEGTTVYRGVDGKIHVLTIKLSNEADDDDVTLFEHTTNEP